MPPPPRWRIAPASTWADLRLQVWRGAEQIPAQWPRPSNTRLNGVISATIAIAGDAGAAAAADAKRFGGMHGAGAV